MDGFKGNLKREINQRKTNKIHLCVEHKKKYNKLVTRTKKKQTHRY